MRNLFLFRGIPGAGKSTVAKALCDRCFAADDYFEAFNGGTFDGSKLRDAHSYCQKMTSNAMDFGHDIAVHNTFTTVEELGPYYELARLKGYTVFSLIVENRHSGCSIHNVPRATIDAMKERFTICL